MKGFIILFISIFFTYSNGYTFLVDKYDKEIELESKIILNIAEVSLHEKVKLFIPHITISERDVYSKIFTLTKTCDKSNFVYVKTENNEDDLCMDKNKLYFTNNYKKLLSNDKYFGAFFWSKSRPNIVFIKSRLNREHLSLPQNYQQFIEDL